MALSHAGMPPGSPVFPERSGVLTGWEGRQGRSGHLLSLLLQLIDLCSPLIQLSPEADKENVDSLLLRF